jgi:phosphoribosylformimino-5-aminoimidazole carboxamide ribotide isomerase
MTETQQTTTHRLMQVIPAIDLLGGRCVRLYKGDFAQVIEYPEDPVAIAARYRQAGMSRLHLVDLDGARSGDQANGHIIARLASEAGVDRQGGGGIRTLAPPPPLLDAGASRVVIGSVAAEDPALALGWVDQLGAEHMTLAFDIRLDGQGEPVVVTRGWTRSSGRSLWELVELFAQHASIEFLCTDVDRDGTLEGPNLSLYMACTARFPGARFIASGGVSGAADLPRLAATGVSGVVTGKALLDGRLTLEEIGRFSRDA